MLSIINSLQSTPSTHDTLPLSHLSALSRWQDVLFTPEETRQLQPLIDKGNEIINAERKLAEECKNSVTRTFDSFEQNILTLTRPVRNVLRSIQCQTLRLLENKIY